MNKYQTSIVERIRTDIKAKRDTILDYRESHIAMNAVITDAMLIDTGLTPAEVMELVQAKADGRLLVLPCKLNRKIYIIDDCKIQRCIVSEIISHGGVLAVCIDADIAYGVYKANIGKTVFLTKPEAQAALDRMEGQK